MAEAKPSGSSLPKIPFNRPVHLGSELKAIAQAIEVNGHTAGGGPFTQQCEELLSRLDASRN